MKHQFKLLQFIVIITFLTQGTAFADANDELYQAIKKNNLHSLQNSLNAGANIQGTPNRPAHLKAPLLAAIQEGNMDIIKYLLKQGADITATHNGWNALMVAAAGGHLEVVKFLIEEQNQDVHYQSKASWTPLMAAATGGRLDIVKYLVDKGAPVKGKAGWKALMELIFGIPTNNQKRQSTEIARYLISKGATYDPGIKKEEKYSELQLAVTLNMSEWVKTCLDRGDNPNHQNSWGGTALMIASINENLEIANMLVAKGANPNLVDTSGYTAMSYAANNDSVLWMEYLVSKGADVISKSNQAVSPLFSAIGAKTKDVNIQWLLDHGADINTISPNGEVLLHFAIEQSPAAAVILIEKGADINKLDQYGKTPLHWAVEREAEEVCRLLLSKGASIDIPDQNGKTVLMHIQEDNKSLLLPLFYPYLPKANAQALRIRENLEASRIVPLIAYDSLYDLNNVQKIALLQEIIDLDPQQALAYVYMANQLMNIDEIDKAREYYFHALELNPQLGEAHAYLSWYYLLNDDFEQAKQSVAKALECDSELLWANRYLAHAYLLSGQTEKAVEVYQSLGVSVIENAMTRFPRMIETELDYLSRIGINVPQKDYIFDVVIRPHL